MTALHKLLAEISSPGLELAKIPDRVVTAVTGDSRQVRPGSVFVAMNGAKQDGPAYAGQAVQKGCCAVVVEQEVTA